MHKYILYLIPFISLIICACRFNPNLQGRGEDSLQGIWFQDTVPYEDHRLNYTTHILRFSCDSVYVEMETFARASYYPDSCFNGGRWKEYAKGTYERKGDTLMISATFTKANFRQKISGCYRIGQYLPVFVIKGEDDKNLFLENLYDHGSLRLTLHERTKCDPKPL